MDWTFGGTSKLPTISNVATASDPTATGTDTSVQSTGREDWENPANYEQYGGWNYWINPLTGNYWIVGGTGENAGSNASGGDSGWKNTIVAPNAPSWWKGLAPTKLNESNTLPTMLNALIPYLSLEDQRTVATNLYLYDPKVFPDPENITFGEAPTDISTNMQRYFTSSQRAQEAMKMLDQLATVTKTKKENMGTGYKFIRNVLDIMTEFGGSNAKEGQTRSQYVQQTAALNALLENAPSGYEGLAQLLSSPSFSAGAVTPVYQSNGQYIFGEGNQTFY